MEQEDELEGLVNFRDEVLDNYFVADRQPEEDEISLCSQSTLKLTDNKPKNKGVLFKVERAECKPDVEILAENKFRRDYLMNEKAVPYISRVQEPFSLEEAEEIKRKVAETKEEQRRIFSRFTSENIRKSQRVREMRANSQAYRDRKKEKSCRSKIAVTVLLVLVTLLGLSALSSDRAESFLERTTEKLTEYVATVVNNTKYYYTDRKVIDQYSLQDMNHYFPQKEGKIGSLLDSASYSKRDPYFAAFIKRARENCKKVSSIFHDNVQRYFNAHLDFDEVAKTVSKVLQSLAQSIK